MDPSRYYHLSSFCQADVAFDDAPVCLGVSLTDKLVFAFLSGMRVFFELSHCRTFGSGTAVSRFIWRGFYLSFSLELAPRKAFGLLVLLG